MADCSGLTWPINPIEPIGHPHRPHRPHRPHVYTESIISSRKVQWTHGKVRAEQWGPNGSEARKIPSPEVPMCVAPQGRLGALTLIKLSLSWAKREGSAKDTGDPCSKAGENWLTSLAEGVLFIVRGCKLSPVFGVWVKSLLQGCQAFASHAEFRRFAIHQKPLTPRKSAVRQPCWRNFAVCVYAREESSLFCAQSNFRYSRRGMSEAQTKNWSQRLLLAAGYEWFLREWNGLLPTANCQPGRQWRCPSWLGFTWTEFTSVRYPICLPWLWPKGT